MRRKGKRSYNTTRNVLIVALIIVFIIVLAASSQRVSPQKYEASEYFEISDAAYFPKTEISTLGFYIKAVKGDASNVHCGTLNMPWPELVGNGTIKQGQKVFVELQLSPPFPVPDYISPGETFPFEITVESTEASGEISILLQKR